MSIIAKDEGRTFHLAPAGMHQAVCFDCWNLGMQKMEFKGKVKIQAKVMIAWEIDEIIVSDDVLNGTRYRLYKKYTNSLNEKAALSKDLISWRGKPFTDAEKKGGFDLESLIERNCFLNIVMVEINGKSYANISAINPLPKNMPIIHPQNPRSVPNWIAKIQASALTQTKFPAEVSDEVGPEAEIVEVATVGDESDLPF